ncbi:MBL fold metallo-hydrolase [Roseomonas sp. NAR14]|uniref:MBL fold metallo-hydrolase n=1 Tax=Roseomonas acroporae TaxID=2937791 RepID=A0A9X1Y532_9PROT|nr:MBL fold metallo-hydrolase [Roseomonas acroporae]
MSRPRAATRRGLLLGAAALAAPRLASAQQASAQQATPAARPPAARTRLVLLGTKGGPRVGIEQANPANLLLVGDTPYVIDCGYGVSRQLVRAGVALPSLRHVFITHHHSDHNLEYGNLVYNAWAGGLRTPVDAYGPRGIEQMTRDFWSMNRFDVETRMADEGRPDPRNLLTAHDIEGPGPVMRDERVRVTAFRTPHPPIVDNYAYKFETPDGVVVFSGDTAYNPALAEFAKGADVLVHEAMLLSGVDDLARRNPNAATMRQHLLDSHTTTEDVGRVAARAGVKLLVLSHFVPGDMPGVTDAMWEEGVRRHYAGRLIVGHDLQEIALPV